MIQFRQQDVNHHEYVFIYVDVFGVSLGGRRGQPWARGDQDDAIARDAFQVRLTCCPTGPLGGAVHFTASTFSFSQNVKILTYREPDNREYIEFIEQLKVDTYKMFNFTAEESMVSGAVF